MMVASRFKDRTFHRCPDRQERVPLINVEQLRNFYNAQPFRPLVIHVADGHALPVHHREFITTVPSERTLIVAQLDDTVNIVDPLPATDLVL
jgi:hypothetical protein